MEIINGNTIIWKNTALSKKMLFVSIVDVFTGGNYSTKPTQNMDDKAYKIEYEVSYPMIYLDKERLDLNAVLPDRKFCVSSNTLNISTVQKQIRTEILQKYNSNDLKVIFIKGNYHLVDANKIQIKDYQLTIIIILLFYFLIILFGAIF